MFMALIRRTFGINEFYRRQTVGSKYSHFSGTEEQLLQAIEQHFPLRKEGRRKGAHNVPLPGRLGKNIRFYTPILRAHPWMFLNAQCLSRSSNEIPLICATGVGNKKKAVYAQAIVYSKDLLAELGEKSSGADFDLISIQASDVPSQPDHPYDIAREILDGGKSYNPKEIAEAIIYWGQHVFVKPKFTKHIDKKIARLISAGQMDTAAKMRQKQVPDESMDDSVQYIDSVQRFLNDTGQYYA